MKLLINDVALQPTEIKSLMRVKQNKDRNRSMN